jgi:hypothetical protein
LVGTATPYQAVNFTVSQFGTYDFMSTATVPPGWDNYGFLYAGNFDPSMPLANALIGADDSPNIGQAGFAYDLFPGTSYYFATTWLRATPTSASTTLSIRGPGDITLVPGARTDRHDGADGSWRGGLRRASLPHYGQVIFSLDLLSSPGGLALAGRLCFQPKPGKRRWAPRQTPHDLAEPHPHIPSSISKLVRPA